ncbi:transposase family protein [Streptomyces sp. IBSBF 2953]|uniref:transposase family protein n=1 Tax=Streptomyces scabiei TaxID=1930 RepID=UPI00211A23B8|nr:transposase family protein [Streptomyces scabiei]MCQ9183498.1 transposase family protein [Streptomyces hayashii]MDX3116009.1 transposase family protein [Streptomyces scabiei]
MLVYPSAIDLSSHTLRHLAGQLRVRRREIGTRWRRLPVGRPALLALAHLRCGDTHAQLAAGFGIGIATAYRYIREAIDVLAALAPTLDEAMTTAQSKAFGMLDGTLPSIDRVAADTAYCSGKHKRHGMNVQVLTDPFGRLLWASPALPGSPHDLTVARGHGIIDALADADVKWPYRGRRLKRWKRRHNSTHAKIRCLVEQAMAVLNGWRLLRKLCWSTNRITYIVKAVLAHQLAST